MRCNSRMIINPQHLRIIARRTSTSASLKTSATSKRTTYTTKASNAATPYERLRSSWRQSSSMLATTRSSAYSTTAVSNVTRTPYELLRSSWQRFSSMPASSTTDEETSEEDIVPTKTTGLMSGGAGFGNVRDRVIPTAKVDHGGIGTLYRHTAAPHTCKVIGAPMTYGQPYTGTDAGPTLLRQAGLRKSLSALGWRVQDGPDLDFDIQQRQAVTTDEVDETGGSFVGHAKNVELVGRCNEQLSEIVHSTLSNGRFPLILGGDHSIGMGSLAGVLRARPNTGVLWIDAHADLNTPYTTESGNMHGMPVGMLMDGVAPSYTGNGSVPGCNWLRHVPKLHPKSIVYVGLRDVDQAERNFIHSLGIFAMTMHEVDRYGIGRVMEMAMDHLLQNDLHRPLHLSYDIDAVDPVLAPATGTTVRGGLTYREANFVAEIVAQSGNLASAEIVELNPTLSSNDGAQETVDLGLQLITTIMGKSII